MNPTDTGDGIPGTGASQEVTDSKPAAAAGQAVTDPKPEAGPVLVVPGPQFEAAAGQAMTDPKPEAGPGQVVPDLQFEAGAGQVMTNPKPAAGPDQAVPDPQSDAGSGQATAAPPELPPQPPQPRTTQIYVCYTFPPPPPPPLSALPIVSGAEKLDKSIASQPSPVTPLVKPGNDTASNQGSPNAEVGNDAEQTEKLKEFVQSLGGQLEEGWRTESKKRGVGGSASQAVDVYYFSPKTNKRFRSRNEVARHLGLSPPPSVLSASPRSRSSKVVQLAASSKGKPSMVVQELGPGAGRRIKPGGTETAGAAGAPIRELGPGAGRRIKPVVTETAGAAGAPEKELDPGAERRIKPGVTETVGAAGAPEKELGPGAGRRIKPGVTATAGAAGAPEKELGPGAGRRIKPGGIQTAGAAGAPEKELGPGAGRRIKPGGIETAGAAGAPEKELGPGAGRRIKPGGTFPSVPMPPPPVPAPALFNVLPKVKAASNKREDLAAAAKERAQELAHAAAQGGATLMPLRLPTGVIVERLGALRNAAHTHVNKTQILPIGFTARRDVKGDGGDYKFLSKILAADPHSEEEVILTTGELDPDQAWLHVWETQHHALCLRADTATQQTPAASPGGVPPASASGQRESAPGHEAATPSITPGTGRPAAAPPRGSLFTDHPSDKSLSLEQQMVLRIPAWSVPPWGLEEFGQEDSRVLMLLEAMPGLMEHIDYKYIETRGGFQAEADRRVKAAERHTKAAAKAVEKAGKAKIAPHKRKAPAPAAVAAKETSGFSGGADPSKRTCIKPHAIPMELLEMMREHAAANAPEGEPVVGRARLGSGPRTLEERDLETVENLDVKAREREAVRKQKQAEKETARAAAAAAHAAAAAAAGVVLVPKKGRGPAAAGAGAGDENKGNQLTLPPALAHLVDSGAKPNLLRASLANLPPVGDSLLPKIQPPSPQLLDLGSGLGPVDMSRVLELWEFLAAFSKDLGLASTPLLADIMVMFNFSLPPKERGEVVEEGGAGDAESGSVKLEETAVPPKEEGVHLKEEGVHPKEEGSPPKEEGVQPKEEGVPPKEEDVQPKEEGVHPKEEDVQPKGKGVHPKEEDVQPSGEAAQVEVKADLEGAKRVGGAAAAMDVDSVGDGDGGSGTVGVAGLSPEDSWRASVGSAHMVIIALVKMLVKDVTNALDSHMAGFANALNKRDMAGASPPINEHTWPEVARRYLAAAATASFMGLSEPRSTALSTLQLPGSLSNLEAEDWQSYLLAGLNCPGLVSRVALLPQVNSESVADAGSSNSAAEALASTDNAHSLMAAESMLRQHQGSSNSAAEALASTDNASTLSWQLSLCSRQHQGSSNSAAEALASTDNAHSLMAAESMSRQHQGSSNSAAEALASTDNAHSLMAAESMSRQHQGSSNSAAEALASTDNAHSLMAAESMLRQHQVKQQKLLGGHTASPSGASPCPSMQDETSQGRKLLLQLLSQVTKKGSGHQMSFFALELAPAVKAPRGLDLQGISSRLDVQLYQTTGSCLRAMAADIVCACQLWKSAIPTPCTPAQATANPALAASRTIPGFEGCHPDIADEMEELLNKLIAEAEASKQATGEGGEAALALPQHEGEGTGQEGEVLASDATAMVLADTAVVVPETAVVERHLPKQGAEGDRAGAAAGAGDGHGAQGVQGVQGAHHHLDPSLHPPGVTLSHSHQFLQKDPSRILAGLPVTGSVAKRPALQEVRRLLRLGDMLGTKDFFGPAPGAGGPSSGGAGAAGLTVGGKGGNEGECGRGAREYWTASERLELVECLMELVSETHTVREKLEVMIQRGKDLRMEQKSFKAAVRKAAAENEEREIKEKVENDAKETKEKLEREAKEKVEKEKRAEGGKGDVRMEDAGGGGGEKKGEGKNGGDVSVADQKDGMVVTKGEVGEKSQGAAAVAKEEEGQDQGTAKAEKGNTTENGVARKEEKEKEAASGTPSAKAPPAQRVLRGNIHQWMSEEDAKKLSALEREEETCAVRRECLGIDRHGNRYWWLCARTTDEDLDPGSVLVELAPSPSSTDSPAASQRQETSGQSQSLTSLGGIPVSPLARGGPQAVASATGVGAQGPGGAQIVASPAGVGTQGPAGAQIVASPAGVGTHGPSGLQVVASPAAAVTADAGSCLVQTGNGDQCGTAGRGWGVYATESAVSALADFISPRGIQEAALKKELQRVLTLMKTVSKAKADAEGSAAPLTSSQPSPPPSFLHSNPSPISQPPPPAQSLAAPLPLHPSEWPASLLRLSGLTRPTTLSASVRQLPTSSEEEITRLRSELQHLYQALPSAAFRSFWGSEEWQAMWVDFCSSASTPEAFSAAVTLLEMMLCNDALRPHWRLWNTPAPNPTHVHTWAGVWHRLTGLLGAIKKLSAASFHSRAAGESFSTIKLRGIRGLKPASAADDQASRYPSRGNKEGPPAKVRITLKGSTPEPEKTEPEKLELETAATGGQASKKKGRAGSSLNDNVVPKKTALAHKRAPTPSEEEDDVALEDDVNVGGGSRDGEDSQAGVSNASSDFSGGEESDESEKKGKEAKKSRSRKPSGGSRKSGNSGGKAAAVAEAPPKAKGGSSRGTKRKAETTTPPASRSSKSAATRRVVVESSEEEDGGPGGGGAAPPPAPALSSLPPPPPPPLSKTAPSRATRGGSKTPPLPLPPPPPPLSSASPPRSRLTRGAAPTSPPPPLQPPKGLSKAPPPPPPLKKGGRLSRGSEGGKPPPPPPLRKAPTYCEDFDDLND
eukprot:gene16238-22404_t